MVNRRRFVLIMALVVSLGATEHATAQRPDPHRATGDQPQATAVATPVSAGCELVESYTNDLYTAIDESDAFADFFYSDADFGDLTAAEAEEIVDDGTAMITALEDLDVPSAYADAHGGIVTFLQVNIDIARFYGIDSSVVPDLNAYDLATDAIYQGEIALAAACPPEIDAVGGYILLDPAGLDEEVIPENVPE
ncbi:MAG TPA: hypothetical protein VGR29_05660 [Thermomicrobiales bacterium]|nr:hypothetical protein [Thermomicrobiales bacterium]